MYLGLFFINDTNKKKKRKIEMSTKKKFYLYLILTKYLTLILHICKCFFDVLIGLITIFILLYTM